jgi:hypothetical protein
MKRTLYRGPAEAADSRRLEPESYAMVLLSSGEHTRSDSFAV